MTIELLDLVLKVQYSPGALSPILLLSEICFGKSLEREECHATLEGIKIIAALDKPPFQNLNLILFISTHMNHTIHSKKKIDKLSRSVQTTHTATGQI